MFLRTLSALAATLALAAPAHAALSVTLTPDASGLFDAYEYEQTFDSLSSTVSTSNIAWANDSTLAGWSLFGSTKAAITYYRASAGAESGGYVYSYGLNGDSDRALGTLGSGGAYWGSPASDALSSYVTLALRNDSGVAITDLTLLWTAEQWRVGESNATTDTMDFRYGLGADFASASAAWVNPGSAFKFNSQVRNTSGTAGRANDGNSSGMVDLGGHVALDWQPGQTLWLTWIDYNSSGFDHGLAIDNLYLSVAVSAVPEPSALLLFGAGAGLLAGLSGVRRARA